MENQRKNLSNKVAIWAVNQRFNNYRLDMNEKELNAKSHRERSERLCYMTHCVSEGSGELSNGMLYFEVVSSK